MCLHRTNDRPRDDEAIDALELLLEGIALGVVRRERVEILGGASLVAEFGVPLGRVHPEHHEPGIQPTNVVRKAVGLLVQCIEAEEQLGCDDNLASCFGGPGLGLCKTDRAGDIRIAEGCLRRIEQHLQFGGSAERVAQVHACQRLMSEGVGQFRAHFCEARCPVGLALLKRVAETGDGLVGLADDGVGNRFG